MPTDPLTGLPDRIEFRKTLEACVDQEQGLLALIVYPLACFVALPAVPVIAGVQHASEVGRWLTGLLLGGLVTATMFLVLQLAITLT